MGMIFFCSPIVSVFTNMFGCRKVAVVGAAVAFVGLLSSSFVRSLGPLYFTYGILFGCGCSFTYQPSLVILGHYFKKRLGLVNGIVTAGSNYADLVDGRSEFGNNCSKRISLDPLEAEGRDMDISQTFCEHDMKSLDFNFCCNLTVQLKHVKERIGEHVPDVTLLLCLGITSGIGRLIFGKIADYIPGAKKVYLQVISFLLIGLMSMMIPLCNSFEALIVVCLIMGLFDGCFISIMAPIAFELVGAHHVSEAIGFLLGLMSIPMTVGPPIAGKLRDHFGTYDVAFYLAGVPPIVGGAILCAIPWVHAKRKRKEQATPVNGETTEKMLEIKSLPVSDSFEKPSKESESVI
ncbi:hypothetical protein Chor_006758 [Crotalus horridus]